MKRIVCLSILAITLCLVLCSCNFSDMLNEFNYIVGIKKDPEYTEGLEFFEIDDDTCFVSYYSGGNETHIIVPEKALNGKRFFP